MEARAATHCCHARVCLSLIVWEIAVDLDLFRNPHARHILTCGRRERDVGVIISATQALLGLASGSLVGFSLGLVGGGGSILAVPLMVYVVGVPEPHVAIGTSAIAVAANAAFNLSNHARGGTVRWSCALTFAAAGIIGAFVGSIFGKMVDGQKLLALFALLMLVIAALMFKSRSKVGLPDVRITMANMPAVVGLGRGDRDAVRLFRHRRRLLDRAGADAGDRHGDHECGSSSLVAVTAFGLTTAVSYAWSGLVSWPLAGLFIAGGIVGGLIGTRSARGLAASAARSTSCSRPSLSPWRSICWRVTYPYLERR